MTWGEIETEHVGYLGSQDTFYVGTFAAVASAKLYTSKHQINSADLLNDRVIPFFEMSKIPKRIASS